MQEGADVNDPTIRAMFPKEAFDRVCPLAPRTNVPCVGPHCMAWRSDGVVRPRIWTPPSPIEENAAITERPDGIEYEGEWYYDEEVGSQVYIETLISAELRYWGYCGMVPPRVLVIQSDRE